MLTVPAPEPEFAVATILGLVGSNVAVRICWFEGPGSRRRCSIGSASQIFAVPSELAVISSVPLKATELTEPECPAKVRTWVPVLASHSRAVPSAPAVTTVVPSGLKAASA
jgi:hypothetical protein